MQWHVFSLGFNISVKLYVCLIICIACTNKYNSNYLVPDEGALSLYTCLMFTLLFFETETHMKNLRLMHQHIKQLILRTLWRKKWTKLYLHLDTSLVRKHRNAPIVRALWTTLMFPPWSDRMQYLTIFKSHSIIYDPSNFIKIQIYTSLLHFFCELMVLFMG